MSRAASLLMMAASVLAVAGCAGGFARPASDVSTTSARLNGLVGDTEAGAPAYWFAYGPTTGYGRETPHTSLPVRAGEGQPVSARVTGLDVATLYHFRLCAADPGQAPRCSADRTFTTHATPVRVTAQPALFPAFQTGVKDYVVRCRSDPVDLVAEAPPGTTVRIAGGPPRSGHVEQGVALSPGEEMIVRTATATKSRTYHVRCLPGDFPAFTFARSGRPSVAYTLTTPSGSLTAPPSHYLALFDAHGVPVWWYRDPGAPFDAQLLSDDTVAYGAYPTGAYTIRRLDGALVRRVQAVGTPTDFHELQELPNGDDVIVSYRPRDHVDLSAFGGPADATVLDAEIQEVAPDGSLVWSWNSKDHVRLAETGRWWPTVLATGAPYDITHINAVEPDGKAFLVSFRHLDAVYRIARSDGHFTWKLGGTTTPRSLDVSGDEHEPVLGGQHDVRRLPDDTITVHDNGSGLGRPPRVERFRIDPTARTARLVEAIRDPQVPASVCCGSARRLPDGHWLVDWGGTPRIDEYAPGGRRLTALTFGANFSYRAVPIPPGRLSLTQLHRGMNAMATAPATPAASRPRLTPRERRAAGKSALPVRQARAQGRAPGG
jgi:hypothetical protein